MMWTTRPRSEFGGLSAIRAGAGPTALLLHGVGLRAEAWNAQIEALAGRFSIVAPDMPGHGASAQLQGMPPLERFTDRVAECLKEPVFVAGHSMGALIALDLAARHPTKVHAVAALNAIFRRSSEAKAAVKARVAQLGGDRVPDPSDTLVRWFGDTQTAERDVCQHWLQQVDPAGYRAAYIAFAQADGPPESGLRELTCPALFLTGSLEPNSTPAMSRAMAELTPKGHAQIVEGAAHMMPMTHPQEVNRALNAFFGMVPS